MKKGITAQLKDCVKGGTRGNGLKSIRSLTDAIREEERMLGLSHHDSHHARQQHREEVLPKRSSYTPVPTRTGQTAAHRLVKVFVKVGASVRELSPCKQAILPPGVPATRF